MGTFLVVSIVLSLAVLLGIFVGALILFIQDLYPAIRRNAIILFWGYGADLIERIPFVFWAILEGVLSIFDPVEAQLAMPMKWRRNG